jgi:hypothetical protein
MPPPVFRFHVPAQMLPFGEMSTNWLFVVPQLIVPPLAAVPLQL